MGVDTKIVRPAFVSGVSLAPMIRAMGKQAMTIKSSFLELL